MRKIAGPLSTAALGRSVVRARGGHDVWITPASRTLAAACHLHLPLCAITRTCLRPPAAARRRLSRAAPCAHGRECGREGVARLRRLTRSPCACARHISYAPQHRPDGTSVNSARRRKELRGYDADEEEPTSSRSKRKKGAKGKGSKGSKKRARRDSDEENDEREPSGSRHSTRTQTKRGAYKAPWRVDGKVRAGLHACARLR
jgi:hypothetical protein